MRLDPATLDELASFYARRLPNEADVIASAARLTAPTRTGVDGWRELLGTADRAGAISTVARIVAYRLPNDENAQVAARDLAPNRGWQRTGAVIAASMAVAGLALGMVLSSGTAQADVVHAAPGALATGRFEAVPAPTAAASPAASPTDAASPAASPTDAASPAASPTAAASPAAADGATAALAPSPRVPRYGCAAPAGQTVGWWYAGETFDGQTGQVVTLDHGANVRAGVPSEANHWQLGAPVGCGLEAGDRVTLGAIHNVPGGVWVELKG